MVVCWTVKSKKGEALVGCIADSRPVQGVNNGRCRVETAVALIGYFHIFSNAASAWGVAGRSHRTEFVVEIFKRLVVAVVMVFIIVVFGLFAFNFYRHYTAGDGPDARPPVIFERPDRPSRA
jgi:hypothetical protein